MILPGSSEAFSSFNRFNSGMMSNNRNSPDLYLSNNHHHQHGKNSLPSFSPRSINSSLYSSGLDEGSSLYNSPLELSPNRSRWSSSSSSGGSLRSPAPPSQQLFSAAGDSYFCGGPASRPREQQEEQLLPTSCGLDREQLPTSCGLDREMEASSSSSSPWFLRNLIELSKLRRDYC